ncbi:MAG: hypothetical protein F4Y01_07085, partial [Gammaproteobacteria bacterium]|nr:hypothetical protein [Gammaproteobacteria bacterium]
PPRPPPSPPPPPGRGGGPWPPPPPPRRQARRLPGNALARRRACGALRGRDALAPKGPVPTRQCRSPNPSLRLKASPPRACRNSGSEPLPVTPPSRGREKRPRLSRRGGRRRAAMNPVGLAFRRPPPRRAEDGRGRARPLQRRCQKARPVVQPTPPRRTPCSATSVESRVARRCVGA